MTLRLIDSVPATLLKSREEEKAIWMEFNPKPWNASTEKEYHRRFSTPFDEWLDRGLGACLLRDAAAARIVGNSLHHFEDTRCFPLAWVVMPNHVHMLFVLHPEAALEKVIKSWKSWTAREINAAAGRNGTVWQKDYFDRLVRDPRHFGNCVRYIRRNPIKAGLRNGEFLLWESDMARKVV